MNIESYHTCHAMGCRTHVAPKMFMCRKHWFELPQWERDLVWRLYRPGQELAKNPSRTYVKETTRIIKEQAIRLGVLDADDELNLEDI